ncbi:hypothetical protein [Sorangium sp. So ce861]|uniref:hypothetical protein n=1 Tax=Sorangium sp. So ce861 TaxID=3133323 RepID=UPI003F5D5BA5
MKSKQLPLLGVSLVLLAQSSGDARAAPVCIDIVAQVELVNDPNGALQGQVDVGSVVTGSYTYESTTPDTNPLSTVGDYLHATPPFGITLDVGNFTFGTDPNNVEFLVEIVNDHAPGIPPTDNYLLRSYNNVSTGPSVQHISWQLDDPTAAALSSEALPVDPPNLADWQSIFGLTIEGGDFFIRAHVTSASACAGAPMDVIIDIKPGSFPNSINLRSCGNVPVAIFSTPTFDAATVDPKTVTLAGAPVRIKGNGRPAASLQDINGDGLLDLVVHIVTSALQLSDTDTQATLAGELSDGTPIAGTDTVRVVP